MRDDLKDIFYILAFGEHTYRGNPLNRIFPVVYSSQDWDIALVLVGRGYDQNLLRRLFLAYLFLLGKEINQFIRQSLTGGDILGNQDGDGFNLTVFDCFILNMIVVNLLKLLILISRGILRHIANGFDKFLLNGIPQGKAMNDIREVIISYVAGA